MTRVNPQTSRPAPQAHVAPRNGVEDPAAYALDGAHASPSELLRQTGTATEQTDRGLRVLVRPNKSLTPTATLMFMGGFAIFTLSIALVFVLQGYWPILPFAGLEIAFVGFAFWYVSRKGEDYDLISVEGGRVSVTQRVNGKEQTHEFDAQWLRVEMVPGNSRMYAATLSLGSHGKRVEVGRALPEEARAALGEKIKEAIARYVSDEPMMAEPTAS